MRILQIITLGFVLSLLSACAPVLIQQGYATMNGKCATANGCHYKHYLMPPFGYVFPWNGGVPRNPACTKHRPKHEDFI